MRKKNELSYQYFSGHFLFYEFSLILRPKTLFIKALFIFKYFYLNLICKMNWYDKLYLIFIFFQARKYNFSSKFLKYILIRDSSSKICFFIKIVHVDCRFKWYSSLGMLLIWKIYASRKKKSILRVIAHKFILNCLFLYTYWEVFMWAGKCTIGKEFLHWNSKQLFSRTQMAFDYMTGYSIK